MNKEYSNIPLKIRSARELHSAYNLTMTQNNSGPLAGLRVLDLAGESGLFCGRMLGELGAEVIKIEPPGGDSFRARGPWLAGEENNPEASLYHLHYNVNKKSVTVNLLESEGQILFRQMATSADVVLETMAPGEMNALGIGFESLREVNPRLIYTTITPFGQNGPLSEWSGNALTGAAMSGLLYLNGDPSEAPNQPAAEQAYHMASLVATWSTLIAIRTRSTKDTGSRVDISVQEAAAMATVQTANANFYTWHGELPMRGGMRHFGSRHLYLCKDEKWASISIRPVRWYDFVQWLSEEGVEPDLTDEKWSDPFFRRDHQDEIEEAHANLSRKFDRDELVRVGQSRRMLIVPVNKIDDLSQHTQLRERDFFKEVRYDNFSDLKLEHPGPAYQFSLTKPPAYSRAPLVGEHNDYMYSEVLNITRDRYDELAIEKII
jgi:crotonobetainyl-CoA:carnitine CoA-transferase CaiB-like acyl-CoA transferase